MGAAKVPPLPNLTQKFLVRGRRIEMVEPNCFADHARRLVFFQPAEIPRLRLDIEFADGNPAGRLLVG